ncbi:FMN-dependent dehydrogenase [Schaalia hyovaginalis]|uniref:FMN-dependent dehydrogenase n=1 Tax=Schaalia hyovaginalis TaxID=29316 RepID=UPI00139AEC4B|nr:FMN-dependent dehydrogenase [Schaalia hyovaginalis]MST64308.1 FMN-dependent dehydrogenase [Schaalia hyovaginalis]
MPSFRTILTVSTLHPGRAPQEVETAARRVRRLESFDIGIEAEQARVTLRFTAEDEDEARLAHAEFLHAVREVADVPRARLAQVVRGRSRFITAEDEGPLPRGAG